MPPFNSMHFQGQELIRVGDDSSFLLLAPQFGARLVRWVHRGEDILYWPENADWSQLARVRGGNPILFPFIARHFVDGVPGAWKDASGTVRALPVHGFARDLPFAVTQFEAGRSLTMTLQASDATRAAYPFKFLFEVTYRLLDDGIEATLRTRNAGAQPLPYYAGHHFYFLLPHQARAASTLAMPAAELIRQRPDGSLDSNGKGADTYWLDDPHLQDTFHVLRPRLAGPPACTLAIPPNAAAPHGRKLMIDLDPPGNTPWFAVTTWSEHVDADYYCVEPWLGLPNAIHHGTGLRWLAPGQEEAAVCRLRVAQ
ncbi:aldose epimerase [Cupriavidus sp. CV2]|uniref:aldose epimerase family protein n=1 Tax=Cupriavidus ulmosensis TaxID=3065913 RepID=UPI00296B0948|nr:aldose epimerase [Cupriavidus sp. CV2]MDW3684396.1 aldose epimerase [Cupriavidus sp. CV2]